MRYLNKVIFLNSAHVPYAEIKVDGNVHFIGTQGVGKSTLLRAILFFYNADKLHLGIPKEKKNFDAFYLPFANSYIIYEVMRENGAYTVMVTKSMGRAAFRFIDAPYSPDWFLNSRREVSADWNEIRTRILEQTSCSISPLVTGYEMFRDIVFGNNRKPDMVAYRKYAVVESSKYQNIPRTIQNVFLNSKLDADFIKDTIIQSMNEEEIAVDLAYYRSQIEAFEQEYNDVMLWIKPNKQGEIIVRKQAEQVISRYRSLLYARKQVEEGRAELNFAEKAAQQRLPLLEEEIRQEQEKVDRLKRLIGEEKAKHDTERDKLIRRDGSLADKLKQIREKQKFYESERIGEVIGRVAKEDSLKTELERLKASYAELTATYKDVIQKYATLIERLETGFQAFRIEIQNRMLQRKEAANNRKNSLRDAFNGQEIQIRNLFEERFKIHTQKMIQLVQDVAALEKGKERLRYTTHFEQEISACRTSLEEMKESEKRIGIEIERLVLECSKLRQKGAEEKKETESRFQTDIEEMLQKRKRLDEEINALNSLIERRKGSFCEWLESHRPGWQETIGKVADEDLILYSQDLHPTVADKDSDTFFGIRLDLSGIRRNLRTPEQLKAELKDKQQLREDYTLKLTRLNQEKEEATARIEKRYKKQIRELSEQQHLLEAQHQQFPVKEKNLKADLATWLRKEEAWKKEQLEQLELSLGAKAHEKLQLEEEEEKLTTEREKRLKQLADERRKAEKAEETALEQDIRRLEEEISGKEQETLAQKRELYLAQNKELDGKGADTAVINGYEQKIRHIDDELKYIGQKRSMVSDYEKDKRELFDYEGALRNEKKEVEASLADLDSKYALRMNRLAEQKLEAEKELDSTGKETTSLREDLEKLKQFRADEYLCPPESYTGEERPTRKTCGVLIDGLKSLILSIQKDTEGFKKAINLFNSNFTAKNTFSFSVNLTSESDYFDFASNLCDFVEENKIAEYQSRISERYTNIIHRISKETGRLTEKESDIHKTIHAINDDFVKRNFAGVIRSIELRHQQSNDKLMQLLAEIKQFNEENQFNMGALDLFSQESRADVNEKAVRYLYAFSKRLKDDPQRTSLVLADTFNLQFRIKENDNDTGWVEKIANVGSDGTDILVKAMVNIMLINVFKERASRKFGDFKIHCMMDEIGKLHPNNVKGILAFANCRNILLINSSPTTYNIENYRYTYLLSKDEQSHTHVVPLLTRKK